MRGKLDSKLAGTSDRALNVAFLELDFMNMKKQKTPLRMLLVQLLGLAERRRIELSFVVTHLTD